MLKNLIFTMSMIWMFGTLAGCSDDTTPAKSDTSHSTDMKTTYQDVATIQKDGLGQQDGPLSTEGSVKRDGIAKSDLAAKTDSHQTSDSTAQTCTTPKKATSNSAATCTRDNQKCPNDGEICIIYYPDDIGVCVGTCCPDKTKPWDDTANRCPVKDGTSQFSYCAQLDTELFACDFPCYIKTKDNKEYTYPCPTTAEFDCLELEPDEVLLPNFAVYKVCSPKQK